MSSKLTKAGLMKELQAARERIAELESIETARALAEREARFSAMIANAKDLIVVIDQEARITFASPAAEQILGYSVEELVGRDVRNTVHPEDMPLVNESFESRSRTPGTAPASIKARVLHKNGEWRVVEALGTNMFDDPAIQGIILNCRDVTEQEHVAANMRENHERFRNLFENSPVTIMEEDFSKVKVYLDELKANGVTDLEQHLDLHPELIDECVHLIRVLDANQAALQLYEVGSKSDLLGGLERSVSLEEYKIFKNELVAVFEGKTEYRSESILISSHGNMRNVIVHWAVVPGHEHDYSKVLVSLHDITERKQMEVALRKSERILRLFVEHSPAAIAMLDRDMKYIVASRRYIQDYELEVQDLTGRSHYEVFPDIPDRWKKIHTRCLNGAVERAEEDPFLRASGRVDWIHWEIHPWYEEAGKIGGIILFSEVITERKNALERLRESEERYQHFISQSFEGIMRTEFDTAVDTTLPLGEQIELIYKNAYLAEVNQAMAQMYHAPLDWFLGSRLVDIDGMRKDSSHHYASLKKFIESGYKSINEEFMEYAMDGKPTWLLKNIVGTVENGKLVRLWETAIDITDRVMAEKALLESEEKYRTLIDATSDGVFVSQDDCFVFCNAALPAMLGYAVNEFLNMPFEKVIAPEHLEIWVNSFKRRLEGKDALSTCQVQLLDKTGTSRLWVELRANRLNYGGRPAVLGIVRDITEQKKVIEQIENLAKFPAENPGPVMRINCDGKLLYANEACFNLLTGWNLEVGSQAPSPLLGFAMSTFDSGQDNTIEVIHDTRIVTLDFVVLRQGDYVNIYGRDITEQREAEEKLRQSEKRFSTIFANSPIAIGISRFKDNILTDVNSALLKLFGYSRDEIIGHTAPELRLWYDLKDRDYILSQLEKQGYLKNFESAIRLKSGEKRSVLVSAEIIDINGETCMLVQLTDITERKKMEEELLLANQRFTELAAHIEDVFWVAEPNTHRNLYLSPAFLKLAGLSEDEMAREPRKFLDVILPEDRHILQDAIELENRGFKMDIKFRIRRGDGGIRWVHDKGTPVFGENGEVIRVAGVASDITEQVEAERRVNESEMRFRQIAESIQEVFWMFDYDQKKIIYVSPAFESIWGRSVQELYEDNGILIGSIHPDDQKRIFAALESQSRGEQTEVEYRVIRPDGSTRWVQDRSFPVYDDGTGELIRTTGIIADITERRLTDEALKDSEERLRLSINAARQGLYDLNVQTGEAIVNREYAEMLGYDPETFVETNQFWMERLHPDDRNAAEKAYLDYIAGIVPEYRIELRQRTQSGGWKWILSIGKLVEYDADGKPLRLLGTHTDIDLLKQAEFELQKRAAQMSLLNDVGQKITGVLDIQGVLDLSARLVHESFGYHHVGLFTLDEDKGELVMRARAGKYSSLFPEEHRIRLGKGVVGTAGGSGQMVFANQVNQDEHYINFFPERLDTLSELSIPIKAADEVVGVLDVQSPLPNAFSADDIQVLQTLSDQVAVAIQNARLYESVQKELAERKQSERERQVLIRSLGERVKELTALHQAARLLQNLHLSESEILKSLVELLPSAWQYPEIAVARIIVDTVVYTSRGFIETPWMQSTIFDLPNGRLGKMEVAYLEERPTETEGPFLFEERNLLETLAERLRSALMRQSMERDLRRRTEELTHLLSAGRALTETLDPQDIYPIIHHYISAEMPCDFLVISSYDPKSELITCEYLHSREGAQDVSNFPPIPLEPPGRGTQSLVIRSAESLLLTDYENALQTATHKFDFNEMAGIVNSAEDTERTRSAIIVPLKVNGVVAGTLQVFSMKVNAHTPDHLRFTEALAFHISAALSNARLFSELEERVKQRTAEVQDLYDNAPTGYHSLDVHGRYVNINQTELNWLGYTRQEMIGHSIREFITEESLKMFQHAFPHFKQRGWLNNMEMEMIRKDGSIFSILVNATAIYDQEGNYLQSRSTVFDNTERKKAELALRESEQTYRALFESANDAIFLIEPDTGVVLGANPHASELLGRAQEELMGKNLLEFIADTEKDGTKEYLKHLLQGDAMPIYERMFIRKDGTKVETEFNLSMICDETGQPKIVQSVVRDISARKRAEETLRFANAEMERSLRLKDEFLANMSHELRTPLNAILGITESLLEQISGPLNAKQQKYLQTVLESAQHLLALINDILDLAKINADRIELDIHKTDISSVAHSSLRMVRELAQKKGINIQLEIDPSVNLAWADERRLKQILVNLLSNAVKFTPQGGRIGLDIRSDQADQVIRFIVWDSGIGIRQEDLHRLFKPFVQLDAGLARGSQGTGLGLVLVSQMARLHGGSVTVESELDKGSRFTVSIPWVQAGNTGLLSGEVPASIKNEASHQKPEKASTILIVEDTESVIMLIRDYLERHGYRVFTARDGFEGLKLTGQTNPDLILMDVMMPEMDGLETTKRIREQLGIKNTPIIALTALAMAGDRERCLAAGMNDYLSKPVKLKELLAVIEQHLNKKGPQ